MNGFNTTQQPHRVIIPTRFFTPAFTKDCSAWFPDGLFPEGMTENYRLFTERWPYRDPVTSIKVYAIDKGAVTLNETELLRRCAIRARCPRCGSAVSTSAWPSDFDGDVAEHRLKCPRCGQSDYSTNPAWFFRGRYNGSSMLSYADE